MYDQSHYYALWASCRNKIVHDNGDVKENDGQKSQINHCDDCCQIMTSQAMTRKADKPA